MLNGVDLHPLTLPQWLAQNVPTLSIYKLFLVAWTLAWCFIGGVFMAYISRGYKMLELVAAGLSLPILIFLIQHSFNSRIIWASPVPPLFLSVLACFILFYFFTKTRARLSMLMKIYVAADDDVKIRPYTSFVVNWIRMAVGLLYLYLPGGILLLALISIMHTLPTIFYLLAGGLASGIALLFQSQKK